MISITHTQDNVDLITFPDKKIFLVGTAHISQTSADLVAKIIAQEHPQSVAVELCESRFQSIQDPDRWKNTDILTIIKQGKGYVLLAQLMLAAFQKKLGGKLQVKPGAEMLRAIECARSERAEIVLADRDVKTTLKRVWASVGFWSMCKLSFSMVGGVLGDTPIDDKEIERLKSSDALEELLREFTSAFPEVRHSLIDERDYYLAEKIRRAPGSVVVAVVGAGHVPGILKSIQTERDLAPLEVIPPKSTSKKIAAWILPGAVLAMLLYGFLHLGQSASLSMISTWIWVNGAFAGLGSLVALGHPLTVLAAFFSAPITSLHPLLASGWVAGIVEAVLRKPRVSDLETIGDDLSSLKGWWSNRVSRILLIMALTNLFGTIGTIIGTWLIASQL